MTMPPVVTNPNGRLCEKQRAARCNELLVAAHSVAQRLQFLGRADVSIAIV